MQADALTADHLSPIPQPGPNLVRFGMLTFLASEAMLFAGLICGYIVLRSGAGAGWRMPEALKNPATILQTSVATAMLLGSSFTLHFGEVRLLRGQKGGRLLLLATVILGGLFLGNQVREWTNLYHEGFWFNTAGIMGSSFFVLTGFHGVHVAIGALMLLIVTARAALGLTTPEKHAFMECSSLYWHFVDIVWVFLFTILYIL